MFRTLSRLTLLLGLLCQPLVGHAAWPAIHEYSQALRAKGTTIFGDAGLRAGTLKRLGPSLEMHSGTTSVVFSVKEADGKAWAVRCFTSKPPHDRHEAIARAIAESGLGEGGAGLFPEMQYIKEGIQLTVGGKPKWFPVVKMGWVSGKGLHTHVHSLVDGGKHAELEQLAEDWRAVHGQMREKNIAHGDLQHGNIKIKQDGKFGFLDLDDVFTPTFRGEESGGLGHPSYAHPTRTGRDFYLDVDNFSSLVIYTSLKALAHDPTLWHDAEVHLAERDPDGKLTRGGTHDNLIFQKSDFDEPAKSVVWKKLAKSPSAEVRKLAAQLEEYAGMHVSEVPPLETILAGKAWKPDGTVPDDFEREERAAPEAAATHAPAPVAPAAPQALKEPGPNASLADWQHYRMMKLKLGK